MTNPASLVSSHASDCPWLGGGGWAAPVELWLRQLSGRAAERHRPDTILRGAQRRWRAVGAIERLARPACAGGCSARVVAARCARHGDQRRRVHRRRDRPHVGPAAVARGCDPVPPVRVRGSGRAARSRMAGAARAFRLRRRRAAGVARRSGHPTRGRGGAGARRYLHRRAGRAAAPALRPSGDRRDVRRRAPTRGPKGRDARLRSDRRGGGRRRAVRGSRSRSAAV